MYPVLNLALHHEVGNLNTFSTVKLSGFQYGTEFLSLLAVYVTALFECVNNAALLKTGYIAASKRLKDDYTW